MCSQIYAILLLTNILFVVVDGVTSNSMEMMERNYPSYAVAVNSFLLSNSSKCGIDLNSLKEGIDDRKWWSLRILDANGIPESGFINGNNFWLGKKSQCLDIGNRNPLPIDPKFALNNSKYRNIDEEFPPFEVDYFLVRARHYSTVQYQFRNPFDKIISLGFCLPTSCSYEELSQIINKIFNDRILLISDLYSMDLDLLSVTALKNDYQWLFDWHSITFGVLLIIIISLTVLGTGYDVIVEQKRLMKDEHDQSDHHVAENYQSNVLQKIFLSFSAYTNTKLIFNTKSLEDNIPVINGLRTLAIVWIIMSHVVYYTIDYIDNQYQLFRLSEYFIAELINNASLSVDTFFVLSGFLLSWSHFRKSSKANKDLNKCPTFKWNIFFIRIFRRIIRLTPAYILLLGISEMYYKWIISRSQFQLAEKPHEHCADYWWRNLLYIHNLFNWESICLTWSWYLAADMQFFIITQFLLLLSDIYFRLSAAIYSILLILSVVLPGYISYQADFSYTLDDFINKTGVIYSPSWLRMGPYLVGIMTAYILIKLKNKSTLSKKVLWLLWIIGGLCLILSIFGLTYRNLLSYVGVAVYMAFYRTVYGVGVAWIVVACFINRAGIVKSILEAKIWIPLSKLVFCSYLINPLIISSIYQLSETPAHLDVMPYIVMTIGVVIMSFAFAYVMTILIEIPCLRLLNSLLRGS